MPKPKEMELRKAAGAIGYAATAIAQYTKKLEKAKTEIQRRQVQRTINQWKEKERLARLNYQQLAHQHDDNSSNEQPKRA